MNHICEYCNKEFKSKSNLSTHVNNAKYCKKLRGHIEEEIISNFSCKICDKEFTSKQTLQKHNEKCSEKNKKKDKQKDKDKIIEKLEKQIQNLHNKYMTKYEEQIKDLQNIIATKPTTINTNTNSNNNTSTNTQNNLQAVNLNPDYIKKIYDEKLSLKDVFSGKKGYIDFLVKNFLTDEKGNFIAWCPDYSRKTIKYLDENKEIIKDIQGNNLINHTSPMMESKGREITKEFKKTYYTHDKNGRFVNKSQDQLSDTEEEEIFDDEDIYFEDEKEEELQRNKNNAWTKVSNILQEIKEYKKDYDPDRIDHYFNKLVKSLNEYEEINNGSLNISNELIKSLPDKPRKSKYAYDGEKTTKFDFDPEKI